MRVSKKRIIPCLDVVEGRVVKGIKFIDLNDIGNPAECAAAYEKQGADEIIFLDINATNENRATMLAAVENTVSAIKIPLCVGGGIRDIGGIEALLKAGAAKVSINSAAVKNPEFIRQAAERFGSERVVVAIDTKDQPDGSFRVVTNGGRVDSGLDAVEWALKVESLGAGEILLTSMDADGTKDGYNIALTKAVSEAVAIPVTASGGCGALEHFAQVFKETNADAALAASLFHYGELTIGEVRDYLTQNL